MNIDIVLSDNIDIDAIIQLHKTVLPSLKWASDRRYLEEIIDDNVLDRDSRCYSVILIGELVGFFHYYTQKRYVWLNTVAVMDGYQGWGIGRRVFEFMETEVKEFKLPRTIKFWTSANQPSRYLRYYESLGYNKFGRDKKWQGFKKDLV